MGSSGDIGGSDIEFKGGNRKTEGKLGNQLGDDSGEITGKPEEEVINLEDYGSDS